MEYTITNRINDLIKELDISANAFAQKLGVKTTIIYNLMKGRNKPSFDLMHKISDTFNVNAQWLLTGEGNITKDTTSNDGKKLDRNDVLNSDSDVTLNRINSQNQSKSTLEYMKEIAQQSKPDFEQKLAHYYRTDPIGIKTKEFEKLKEKYNRRLTRELVNEDETLQKLSFIVDHLQDTIELVLHIYMNNINTRPDPFEISQYFDFQAKLYNAPDTIDYNQYKENTIVWLKSLLKLEPALQEFYKQNETFLERLNAFEQSN